MLRLIGVQLARHGPFTALGTLIGLVVLAVVIGADVPREVSARFFWMLHPLHVLLSALVTASMFRLGGGRGVLATVAVGWVGSAGIATLSDSIIPFLGEWMLGLPNRGLHVGFVEKAWLVNPLALGGIAVACVRPTTRLPHAGHVLLSTLASLFHMSSAFGETVGAVTVIVAAVFLFLAVWVPCCTSDIVFPLLFVHHGAAPRENRR
jgi:hypothetical protein